MLAIISTRRLILQTPWFYAHHEGKPLKVGALANDEVMI